MKSWQVLQAATERVGVKAVAAKLGLSAALVYKWCQQPPAENPDGSGAHNPLDRIKILYELTRDQRVINWLCNVADGFFVPNPKPPVGTKEEELLGITQQVVGDFGDLLADISGSIENDGVIAPEEAEVIRQAWERLKAHAECFVVACERGIYARPRPS